MVEEPDRQPPRLDPLAPPEARAEHVRELKALIDAGDYRIPVDDIAGAILAEVAGKHHYE